MILILSKILMKRAKELNLNFYPIIQGPPLPLLSLVMVFIFHRMLFILFVHLCFFNLIIVVYNAVYTILDNTSSCFCSSWVPLETPQSLPDNSIPSVCSSSKFSPQIPSVQVTRCKESVPCADMAWDLEIRKTHFDAFSPPPHLSK